MRKEGGIAALDRSARLSVSKQAIQVKNHFNLVGHRAVGNVIWVFKPQLDVDGLRLPVFVIPRELDVLSRVVLADNH